jgi:nucleotidyltransferase AbiEii toxin of type IV toxin-antitoxin system
MEKPMIPEPQRTYVLELWAELGCASVDFVLVGGQALKFAVPNARATKDFDFVLDVIALRQNPGSVRAALDRLEYAVVPESRNFQFVKPIPNSVHTMRVELLAPEEHKRENDIRVDVGGNVHACVGGTIVLAESDLYEVEGHLPSGATSRAAIRVSRPHALVFMKCLAIDDRYRNLRGIRHFEHDRDSARVHVADVVDILTVQADPARLRQNFIKQFDPDPGLRGRVAQITRDYFTGDGSPGLVLYEEYLALNTDLSPEQISRERGRALRLLTTLLFA